MWLSFINGCKKEEFRRKRMFELLAIIVIVLIIALVGFMIPKADVFSHKYSIGQIVYITQTKDRVRILQMLPRGRYIIRTALLNEQLVYEFELTDNPLVANNGR